MQRLVATQTGDEPCEQGLSGGGWSNVADRLCCQTAEEERLLTNDASAINPSSRYRAIIVSISQTKLLKYTCTITNQNWIMVAHVH